MKTKKELLLLALGRSKYSEASGPIAHWKGGVAAPLRSLLVSIDPVQDLHGYDNPWPAGGGKNKFNVNAIPDSEVLTVTNGNIVITSVNANTMKTLGDLADVVVGETYILTATSTASANYIYLVTSATSWYFGTSRTITQDDVNSRVIVYGASGETTTISNMMIRLSTVSDATFAPYSNICPISGWTGANVWRTGKNLLDPSKRVNYSTNIYYYRGSTVEKLLLKAGRTYTLSVSETPSGLYIYDAQNSVLAQNFGSKSLTYTPQDDVKVHINIYYASSPEGGTSSVECQFELSSTATDYAPYTGATYPITWETEAGTVYGGEWDVLAGKLRVRPYYASYAGETLVGPWVSSMDKYEPGATPTTGAQVVDLGGTVTEYTLTPAQLETLVGTNVVWADCGSVDVEYRDDQLNKTAILLGRRRPELLWPLIKGE